MRRLLIASIVVFLVIVVSNSQLGVAQAATVVTKVGDTDDGVCDPLDCSLREALRYSPTGSTINVPSGVYGLNSTLVSTANQTIVGSGATSTVLLALGEFRIMEIHGNLALSHLTIKNGNEPNGSGGGLSITGGEVTLESLIVNRNRAASAGGGIYVSNASVTLADTTVEGNTVLGSGGGVYARNSSVFVRNSVFADNIASSGAGAFVSDNSSLSVEDAQINSNFAWGSGAGMFLDDVDANIGRIAIYDNESSGRGGGIFGRGNIAITNSTVSGNRAKEGGGMYLESGTATLVNGTIAFNTASVTAGGLRQSGGTLNVVNTVIFGNRSATAPNCNGIITSLGHNLLSDNVGCPFASTASDLVGTAPTPIDPLLGALQDNGGITPTHALSEGSPAIDAADDTLAPETDQRGVSRPLGEASDIGAYESDFIGNSPPAAGADSYSVIRENVLVIGPPGVLSNDSDPDGDTLTAVLVEGATSGLVDLEPTGAFTYTPDPGFEGSDSFTYSAFDASRFSDATVVSIYVTSLQFVVVEPEVKSTVRTEAEFAVDIVARNANSLAGVQLVVDFDPDVLLYLTSTQGSKLGVSGCESAEHAEQSAGRVSLTTACSIGMTADNLLLWKLSFGAIAAAGRIDSEVATSEILLSDSQSPPDLIPSAGASAQFAVIPGKCGDQNGDGIVDVRDAVIDLQIITETIEPTLTQLVLSDINRDGSISVLDVISILKHIVDQETPLDDCGL